MEALAGQHDTVLALKEFPGFVMTKVENEEKKQQHSSYMETTESNLYIKSEEDDIKLEEIDYESKNAVKKEYLGSEIERDFNAIDNLKQEDVDIDENQFDLKNEADTEAEQKAFPSIPVALLSSNPGGQTIAHQNTLDNITSTYEISSHDSKYTPNQEKQKSPKKKKCYKTLLKCEQCSYVCNFSSQLHLHMRIHKDPSELDMYACTQCDYKTKHRRNLGQHSVVHKNAADVPTYKCNFCYFEAKRKVNLKDHLRRRHDKSRLSNPVKQKPQNKSNSVKGLLKCEQCSYECNYPSRLHAHMHIHKDRSELDMYECTECDFKTKYKRNLRDHSFRHKDATDIPGYKCHSCDFETKRKVYLKKHIRRCHNTFRLNSLKVQRPKAKNSSEKGKLKCKECSYECSYPSRLHLHMRIHKDQSELDMYECTQCDFKTKHKRNLREHSFLHKNSTDIPRYTCNSCGFETKRKVFLKKHIRRRHNPFRLNGLEEQKPETKNRSEKRMLKCKQCSYECSYANRLSLHMRIHIDPSELDMYECTQCDFKTKHKRNLREHSILHKNATDIPRYKCNSCDFETKRKVSLKQHIWRRHNTFWLNSLEEQRPKVKNRSKKGILKCKQCPYECSYPSRLHLHMRIHKDRSELDMYECTQCDFKTKYKGNLKKHSIRHKNVTDVPTYTCNFCDFETKREGALRRHNLRHRKNI